MTAAPPPNTLYARAAALVRRIGVPTAVLFAACCSTSSSRRRRRSTTTVRSFVDFGLLPGIFAMAAVRCGLRSGAAVAGVAGAGVLVFSTLFIHAFHLPPYSSVLPKVTITEVVAGVLMVYYVARRARADVAFCVVGSLVVAVSSRSSAGTAGSAKSTSGTAMPGAAVRPAAARRRGGTRHRGRDRRPEGRPRARGCTG